MTSSGSRPEELPTRDITDFSVADVSDVLWTLTDRCNLKCLYCKVVPHEGPKPVEPSCAEVDRIIDQLATLPSLESVIVSGGEALMSRHLDHVLGRVKEVAPIQYVITNGTTLSTRAKDALTRHRPRVMITVDSTEEARNAVTRGAGVLAKATSTIEWLQREGIFTIVIIVATRFNIRGIASTLAALQRMGVCNILIQQLHCSDPSLRDFFVEASPNHAELEDLFVALREFKEQHPGVQIDDNEICFFHHRLRFKQEKCELGHEYLPARLFQCGAGYKFFAIKANGDVIPCNAFLNCVLGNLHESDIGSILTESPELIGLRNLRTHRVDVIPGCAGCTYSPVCDGGCRADAFNLTGEIGSPHPNCHMINVGSTTPDLVR